MTVSWTHHQGIQLGLWKIEWRSCWIVPAITSKIHICKLCKLHVPLPNHDAVIKWKHFPCYWPFMRGIHQWPVDSPHKGQWCRTLMFSLICAWTMVEQTIGTPVILDTITLIMTSMKYQHSWPVSTHASMTLSITTVKYQLYPSRPPVKS